MSAVATAVPYWVTHEFRLHDAPEMPGHLSLHLKVYIDCESGWVWGRIEGTAVLKSGRLGRVTRGTGFDLTDNVNHRPAPDWVLDLLDKYPALALYAAQARERGQS